MIISKRVDTRGFPAPSHLVIKEFLFPQLTVLVDLVFLNLNVAETMITFGITSKMAILYCRRSTGRLGSLVGIRRR